MATAIPISTDTPSLVTADEPGPISRVKALLRFLERLKLREDLFHAEVLKA